MNGNEFNKKNRDHPSDFIGANILNRIIRNYWYGILIITPILLIMAILFFGPMIHQIYFVDSEFCLGTEDNYLYNYEIEIQSEAVTDLLKDHNIMYISMGSGLDAKVVNTCSENSEEGSLFTVDSIRLGDIIWKEANTNFFSVEHNGGLYHFKIERSKN